MSITVLVIFIITYIGIIFTRLPGINIGRPAAAFLGAVCLTLVGAVSFDEAIGLVDFNTLALLMGMMIVIAGLRANGFFALITERIASLANTRLQLLSAIVFLSGLGSAFLVNDAVVLLFTPIIIHICHSSKCNPLPYLIGEMLSANAGSVLTMTGNPQNMLIGMASGMSYSTFLLRMAPIAFGSMLLIIWVVKLLYRQEFSNKEPLIIKGNEGVYDLKKLYPMLVVFSLVVLGFFLGNRIGLSIPLVALGGSMLTFFVGRTKPEELLMKVDWVLLLFFGALFIVVGTVERAGLLDPLLSCNFFTETPSGLGMMHGISLVVPQLVSNVPYVMLVVPILKGCGSDLLWLALASASTLAGNATLLGAMANIIVVESAKREGVTIGTWEFMRAGLLITILSMLLSFITCLFYLYYMPLA